MRETLLDLMIRFNEGNMLDPWNENEEELDDLDDLLGSYRRGTLGSYQAGTGIGRGTDITMRPPDQAATGGGSTAAPATPFGGNVGGVPEETASKLAGYGEGFLEPGSDQSKRWMENMRGEIGRGTDAAQRAAGYQAAQSGFGSGASPELLQMQGDIGVAGQEAAGQAASDFMLRAPELGVGAMSGALGSQVGMRGQDLTSSIAQMGDARAQQQADALREYQDQQLELQKQEQERRAKLDELAALYSGQGTTGGGGGGAYQPPGLGGWSLGVA